MNITLKPLEIADREKFIRDNQESFRYGALEEFGLRDEHYVGNGPSGGHGATQSTVCRDV